MTSKRILHIGPTPFFSDRGAHIRIEGIVRCLQELGYENLLCTYHHGRDIAGVNCVRIAPIEKYTQTEAGPSKHKLRADWRLLWLCMKHYRTMKPVAIHAHLHEGLLIGWLIKSMFFWRKTPLIADMQGSLTGELAAHGVFEKYRWLSRPTRWFEKVLMRSANFVICSSEHSLGLLELQFSIPKNRIALVQDGADKAPALSAERRSELMKKYNLPEGRKLVVYSGALLDSKGLGQLKRLIKDCADLADQAHFLIIGYPTENLSGYLDENDLTSICTMVGQVKFEQLADFLSLSDIGIDPKNADSGEGSGKMLNYLSAGLPVVAFDTRNNAGFLPLGSPLAVNQEQFSGQLRLMLADAGLSADFAEQNLRRFEENYSWDVTRQQLKTIYGRIIEPETA